ncbi:MAG: hypothetical protein ACE5JR_09260 [Gemmatimonadota bacterium]
MIGVTHRLHWPSRLTEPAEVVELAEQPHGFPPPLLYRDVTEGGETHVKQFVLRGRDTVQLTFGGIDDSGARWSPDGRHILLSRGWRASETRFQQNLFLLDTLGQMVRQVTHTRWQDGLAAWSPTGSRIAFSRDSAGTTELWVSDADGERPANLTVRHGLPRRHLGAAFSADGRSLAAIYNDVGTGRGAIYLVDLRADLARTLPVSHARFSFGDVVWSPDGRWLAYVAVGDDGPVLWVAGVEPGLGAYSLGGLPPKLYPARWIDGAPSYIAELEIAAEALTLRSGEGAAVGAVARTAAGDTVSLALRWSVADPPIARVTENGFLVGRRPGTTSLIASAGGFREDTISVNVAYAPADTLFYEDWSGGIDTARWAYFGHPRSLVVAEATPERRPVFLNNGDYNHGSGVVSRREFEPWPDGLTLEAEAWFHFRGQHWQIWSLALFPDLPSPVPAEKRLGPISISVTGHEPTRSRPSWSCAPRGAQGEWEPQAVNRRWWQIALQVRPDGYGECWMDGELLESGRIPSQAQGRPLSIRLRGQSVGTEIYHGRVVVTRGLRY